MASNSGWTTGLPSGNSLVKNTDEEFRSVKSYVEAWLEQEHYVTDGSATSAGVHKSGSARAHVDTAANITAITATGPPGEMGHATDTDGFYVHDGTSWVLVTNAMTLGSTQTWTGDNQFGDGTTGELIVDPVDGQWKVEGLVSGFTILAADLSVGAGGQNVVDFVNVNSALTSGDPITAGSTGTTSADLYATAYVVESTASVRMVLYNNSGSAAVVKSGSTHRYLGFKTS